MRAFVRSRLKRHSDAISAKAKSTTSVSTHNIPPVSQSSLAGKPYSVKNHNNLQQLWHVLKAPSVYRELPPFVVIRLVKNLELQLLSSTTCSESRAAPQSNIKQRLSTLDPRHILRLVQLIKRARHWAKYTRRFQRKQYIAENLRRNWNNLEAVNMQRVEASYQRPEHIRFFERRTLAKVREQFFGLRVLEYLGLVLAEAIPHASSSDLSAIASVLSHTPFLGSALFRETLQEAICRRLIDIHWNADDLSEALPYLLRAIVSFSCPSAKTAVRSVLCPAVWALQSRPCHKQQRSKGVLAPILLATYVLRNPHITVTPRFFIILTSDITRQLRDPSTPKVALPALAAFMESIFLAGIYDRRFVKLLAHTIWNHHCRVGTPYARRQSCTTWIRILHCLAAHHVQHQRLAQYAWGQCEPRYISTTRRELLLSGITAVGHPHGPCFQGRRPTVKRLYAQQPNWEKALLGQLCVK